MWALTRLAIFLFQVSRLWLSAIRSHKWPRVEATVTADPAGFRAFARYTVEVPYTYRFQGELYTGCIKSLRSAVSALDLCDDSRKADASSCTSNPESRKSRLCEKEIRRTASSILSEISFSPRDANTVPREGRYCALSSTSPVCPAIVSVGPTGFPFTSTYDPEGKVTVAVS